MTSASHAGSPPIPEGSPSTYRVLCDIDGSPSSVVAAQSSACRRERVAHEAPCSVLVARR